MNKSALLHLFVSFEVGFNSVYIVPVVCHSFLIIFFAQRLLNPVKTEKGSQIEISYFVLGWCLGYGYVNWWPIVENVCETSLSLSLFIFLLIL